MQEKIFDMLIDEDEITWQSIIYTLVKSEEMDPWDIDISLLTQKYLERIKKLEELNFYISGKVLLALAILLRIKSVKLVDEDIADFDDLLFPKEGENILSDDFEEHGEFKYIPSLLIKTPQARKRKLNLNDLMEALQAALEVETKRMRRKADERVIREVELPLKKIDITSLMKNLYNKLKEFFKIRPKVKFSELLPSNGKEDKVLTFLPLLHLENQGKINMEQDIPFGEIDISEYKEDA